MTDTDARIDALEEKIAFQDQVIEDLNAAVTDQWREIDMLKRQLANLVEEVKEMELEARAPAGREPPPPHY